MKHNSQWTVKIIRVSVAVIALVTTAGLLSAQSLEDQKAARATYAELAAKVRAGDLQIDWQRLRVSAVIGGIQDAKEEFQAIKAGQQALEQGNNSDALKLARQMEDQNIANADAHYVAWRSLVGLSRETEAEKERQFLMAFMGSIMKSGDGKSAGTAWFAATIREEYLMMEMILDVKPQAQHSQKIEDHYYDVVAVTDQSGKQMTLWFNTDTDFQRMQIITDRLNQKQ